MSVSLPNFKPLRPGSPSVAVSSQEDAGLLFDKHQDTIRRLRDKLGFKQDKTVIAWLLEQIEQSADIDKITFAILSNPRKTDGIQYNEFGRARVSLELSRDIIESIDKFKGEWGVTSRGAIVERLLVGHGKSGSSGCCHLFAVFA
jgi:hypothetical protein